MRFFFQFVTPGGMDRGLGKTAINAKLEPSQGFVVEAIITLVLILVIHSVCDEAPRSNTVTPALSIGLTIAAAHLAAVSSTRPFYNELHDRSVLFFQYS